MTIIHDDPSPDLASNIPIKHLPALKDTTIYFRVLAFSGPEAHHAKKTPMANVELDHRGSLEALCCGFDLYSKAPESRKRYIGLRRRECGILDEENES